MEYDWRYDENVQIGTDYENVEQVAEYDRRMGQLRNFNAEIAAATQALNLTAASTVWDIGTGTAEIALGLAQQCRHVDASDISSVMLDYAQKKTDERQINNISFHHGGFLGGFYPAVPIDGCITQLAFHHLPDAWKMVALHRIADALKPGGRFFLKDVVFPDGKPDYEVYFSESVAAMGTNTNASNYARHIKQEYSTFSWVLEGMLERVGLQVISRNETQFLTDYICVKTLNSRADVTMSGW